MDKYKYANRKRIGNFPFDGSCNAYLTCRHLRDIRNRIAHDLECDKLAQSDFIFILIIYHQRVINTQISYLKGRRPQVP